MKTGAAESYQLCYLKNLEHCLLQLTLLLIPSNLAYHWYVSQAYVNGRLIDYLLPRLYLSDLTIITLISIRIWHSRDQIREFIANPRRLLGDLGIWPMMLVGLLLLLLLISITSAFPIPSTWAWFKFIEFLLFFWYLRSSLPRMRFLSLAIIPLTASLFLQVFIAFYQYINQSSVIGYILLGEPTLTLTHTIATGLFPGGLKILPYGTTPHPHVLAGFTTIATLLLLLAYKYNPKIRSYKYHSIIIIVVAIMVIGLTQSLASLLGLIIGLLVLYCSSNSISKSINRLLIMSISASILAIGMILIRWSYHSYQLYDNSSLIYRYKLLQHALDLLYQHPLTGTGLNLFIPMLINNNLVTTAPFFQPVHNIYLLWLAETGLVGLVLAGIGLYLLFKAGKIRRLSPFLAPLAALCVIGFLDHYPLTLQTGQLLLAISLYLVTAPPSSQPQ